MAQNSSTGGAQCGAQFQDTQVPTNVESSDGSLETDRMRPSDQEVPLEVADMARSQEITAKSVSGILILLLKWFKLSRKMSGTLYKAFKANENRCTQIRVSNTTFARLKLHSVGSKASPRSGIGPGSELSMRQG